MLFLSLHALIFLNIVPPEVAGAIVHLKEPIIHSHLCSYNYKAFHAPYYVTVLQICIHIVIIFSNHNKNLTGVTFPFPGRQPLNKRTSFPGYSNTPLQGSVAIWQLNIFYSNARQFYSSMGSSRKNN